MIEKNKEYVVLANFDKPWFIRCRSDLDIRTDFEQKAGCYKIEGTWYWPIFRGSASQSKSIATVMKMIAKTMS